MLDKEGDSAGVVVVIAVVVIGNERDVVLCWQGILMPYNSQAKSDVDSGLMLPASDLGMDLGWPFAVVWEGSPYCRILWAKPLTVWHW
ncbi:hypothetical protein FA13DRAFT_1738876 [Coprinellus micaceus]|uniref:Uncharacterized protein n=1 Tax=Coprinellus micaceus TaxID=71717 RepID=A0A4Y7SSL5_COPMI|nr:hypothetical protein FA13DRAFT_1738876 [Coprinellus micaceus]